MIASEKTEEKAAPVEKSAPKEPAKPAETPKVAPTAPATKTAQTTVSRKVEDLRAEAEALIKEQQALKDAKNKTTSKEDNLLNMAKQVQLNRQWLQFPESCLFLFTILQGHHRQAKIVTI